MTSAPPLSKSMLIAICFITLDGLKNELSNPVRLLLSRQLKVPVISVLAYVELKDEIPKNMDARGFFIFSS